MQTLFSSPTEPPSSASYLATLLTSPSSDEHHHLIPHDDGLCSRVYRAKDQGGRRIAIKVVVLEDQVRPHDVKREIRCLKRLMEGKSGEVSEEEVDGQKHIIQLRAAFLSTSDPFATAVYLVLPFADCTVLHLLEDPALFCPSSTEQLASDAQSALDDDRPASFVISHIASLAKVEGSATRALVLWVTNLMRQLFSGLAFMHGRGIAHRDIKPSNLLLVKSASPVEAPSLRIIDFGTAWESGSSGRPKGNLSSDDVESGQTSEVGTAGYRAPELLFAPAKGYDATKIDIWSAACVAASFFTELEDVPLRDESERDPGWYDDDDSYDEGYREERPEWERDIWGEAPHTRRGSIGDIEPKTRDEGSQTFLVGDGESRAAAQVEETIQPGPRESGGAMVQGSGIGGRCGSVGVGDRGEDAEAVAEPLKPKRRRALFDASRGDLAFAGDIFEVLGLPSNEEGHLWPEAADFRPPLSRMPFLRRPPAPGGVFSRLTGLDGSDPVASGMVEMVQKGLVLSASGRASASILRDAAQRLGEERERGDS